MGESAGYPGSCKDMPSLLASTLTVALVREGDGSLSGEAFVDDVAWDRPRKTFDARLRRGHCGERRPWAKEARRGEARARAMRGLRAYLAPCFRRMSTTACDEKVLIGQRGK